MLEICIEDAECLRFDDFADLFRAGGVGLINELVKHKFSLIPYFDNGNSIDVDEFYSSDACAEFHDFSVSKLGVIYNELNAKNKELVKLFLIAEGHHPKKS